MTNQNQWTDGSRLSMTSDGIKAIEIARLLSHYYLPGISAGLERATAHDWKDDLANYSAEVVTEACARWRRNNDIRPKISNIRDLCAVVAEERALAQTPRLENRAPSGPRVLSHWERIAARRTPHEKQMLEVWWSSRGYPLLPQNCFVRGSDERVSDFWERHEFIEDPLTEDVNV